MKIGVYYYPEQWPRQQWERDFDHIAAMGLQIVHMGEVAWFTMEPRAGDIQLDWLSERYGSIEKLNEAWGNQFWNQYYTDFSQVMMPPSRDPKYGNPHQHLDASRFWSSAFAKFCKLQTDILRPRIGERFITTNFM